MEQKPIKAIITGTTGMVGKGVLIECIDSPLVSEILIINRRSLGLEHPKVKEILIPDFFQLDSLKKDLKEYDCCFFCLGITSIGLNERDYTHITYDLTIQFAETFLNQNHKASFIYVSGTGTDSTENGKTMWARVKGKTENTLLNMGFSNAYMFRPGYIQPMKGIRSRTSWYNALYMILKPLYFLLKLIPGFTTNTVNVGKAMINAIVYGSENPILHNKDINKLAKKH